MEATLFATLMSVMNAGNFTSGLLGSVLTALLGVRGEDFSRLPLLVTLCTLCTALPLALLRFVPNTAPSTAAPKLG